MHPYFFINNLLLHKGMLPTEMKVVNHFSGVKATIEVMASYYDQNRDKAFVKWVFYFFVLPAPIGYEFRLSCFEKFEL